MGVTFYRVKEGEFSRLVETQSITKFIAQESEIYPLKFSLVGINHQQKLAYIVRHGRNDELRTWRLDNLGAFLKKLGVTNWEVQQS
ncbi:hypothetical protein [Psychrobium sp. 1_MG-2023]|uniref:hypothetical protein n=1 Tax=Psychrobium sp. 1_MG-2023 TaxID=3062624 RepID=UPI000C3400BC|nr:hypothetical protein [Psychrobium sp. 1_MG-2023]MDP2560502.1 hypothetical protein [Psychrobium sp. 1_MG-2023]PKF55198.1 hypothetical protein CW748_13995 [Alteromonadales bacterium alter-6D02]